MITKHLLTFRWPIHRQVERFRSLWNSVETKEASCFLFSVSFSSLFFKHLETDGWVVGCVQREEGVKSAHAWCGKSFNGRCW